MSPTFRRSGRLTSGAEHDANEQRCVTSETRCADLGIAKEMVTRLHESTPGSAPVVPLTRRELEVASLAAKGMADRDIATVLHVSVRTVESHVAATYRKLDIRSRNGLRGALTALGISA